MMEKSCNLIASQLRSDKANLFVFHTTDIEVHWQWGLGKLQETNGEPGEGGVMNLHSK
jgi:hypothetical protein